MATALSLEADVLPVLAAFQTARGHGTISIFFEDGIPKTVTVNESLKLAEQVRQWLRRFTRRPQS